MNVVFSSTGFAEPNYNYIAINKDNLSELGLDTTDSIDNLIVHRCFHLLSTNKVIELLQRYYQKLKVGGKLTIYCIDIYEFCHKVHRRELNEGDFHNILYENGQINSVSTLFFIENCCKIGFNRAGVYFDNVWAKLEFIK